MSAATRRYLKLTMNIGGGIKLRIVERPGLSLSPDELATLVADLRKIAATSLPAEELEYGILGGDRERAENVIVTLMVDSRTNEPVGFNALAPMEVSLAGRPVEVLHLGLVMLSPAVRGRGLTDVLYGLTCFLLFLRGQCRPIYMSNVTQVPAVFGMVSSVFDDVWPTPERTLDSSFTHRTLARQIMERYRYVFGVGPEAQFDEARSIILDSYTGGSDNLKKTFDEATKHRNPIYNDMCAKELDYNRGDDFLQIGQINMNALRRYLSSVATPQTAPWLAGQFAIFGIQSAILPVVHWFSDDRPFGALRPWKRAKA
jgi:hypothetical protein